MVVLAFIAGYIAAAGALVSWAFALFYYFKTHTLIGPEHGNVRWLAIVAWPFAAGRLSGAARASADKVNAAMIAFFLCLFVAAGAFGAAVFLTASRV